MSRVDVGDIDDFQCGQMRLIEVNGREIGLVRWGDEVYAMRNHCPHEGAPLCIGVVEGLVTQDTTDGAPSVSDRPVVCCPWHGWEFDLADGRSIVNPRVRAKTFRAEVVESRVFVDPGSRRGDHSGDAPAQA